MSGFRDLNIVIEAWGVAFCFVGILCTLLFMRSELRYCRLVTAMFACELASLAGDAVAGVFRGQEGFLAWLGTHGGNLVGFCASYLLIAVFTSYLCIRLSEGQPHSSQYLQSPLRLRGPSEEKPPKGERDRQGGRDGQDGRVLRGYAYWARVAQALALVFCVLTALGLFYTIGEDNLYRRTDMFWLSAAYPILAGVVNTVLVLRAHKSLDRSAFACLLLYASLPLASCILQVLYYGLNLNAVMGILGLVIVFVETQSHLASMLVRAREEAAEARIAAMASQIQPHFMFNTLNSIYYLSEVDPPQSQRAIDRFSTYLRANLDSLERTEPVPIDIELEHVCTYLELEKMSKADLLEYEVESPVRGFSVPALSVQTIVENAVRHGVGKKVGGGHVSVSTGEDGRWFFVSIVDDGVGFDASAEPGEGRHVGIANSRARLAAMCGGELDVESEPGIGTTAILRVPKEQGDYSSSKTRNMRG